MLWAATERAAIRENRHPAQITKETSQFKTNFLNWDFLSIGTER